MVCRKFRQTTQHGAMAGKTQSKEVKFYNLDVIISVGCGENLLQGTRFRQWATERLNEYMSKRCLRWTMNDSKNLRWWQIQQRISFSLHNYHSCTILHHLGVTAAAVLSQYVQQCGNHKRTNSLNPHLLSLNNNHNSSTERTLIWRSIKLSGKYHKGQ